MSEAQNNDFVIETSNRIRTRVPGDMVNAYLSDTSVINDLNISVSNANDIEYLNTQSTSNTTQLYPLSLSPDQLYSTCIIKRSNLSVDITNIKVGYNQNVLNLFTINVPDGANNDYFPINVPAGAQNETEYKLHRKTHFASCLPHTYLPGLFGTVCDPMAASTLTSNITVGTSASQVAQETQTPMVCDVIRNYKTDYQDEIRNNYDGLLNPDSYNIAYYRPTCDLRKNICGTVLSFATGICESFVDKGNKFVNNSYCLSSNLLTLDEINACPHNMLSTQYRGRLLRPDRATYVFTKSVASVNYSCSAGGQITADGGTTTELYTCIVGDYQFPTNIKNWEILVSRGLPIEMVFFYFDKPKFFVGATAEPNGQALNINIKVNNVESPILNPILQNTFRHIFSNASTALIRCDMHTNLENFIFQNTGVLSQQSHYDFANSTSTLVNAEYGNISAKWSDSIVYLRQYVLEQLQSVQKKITLLPYVLHTKAWQSNGTLQLPTRIDPNDSYSGLKFGNGPLKFNAVGIDIGDAIPKYAQIVIDTPLPYEFTSIQITFNNTKPVILTNIQRLREASYKNGMNLTRKNYTVPSNNSFGYSSGSMTSMPRVRDVLLLELGSDIPLESMMVPGLTNKSIKMTYAIEASFDTTVRGIADFQQGDTRLNYEVQIIHLTEQEYIIEKNRAENRTSLFTTDDVLKSITSMENTILGNKIRSSRAALQGGNIFSAFSKLRSVVPKVLGTINTAANVASNVAGTVGKVAETAKSFTGGNASRQHIGVSSPVQIPMSQLLGHARRN